MIFDTHAHYDDEAFDVDRDALLESMKNNGVVNIVNVGASMDGARESVSLAHKYDMMYGAVGVHPSELCGLTDDDLKEIVDLSYDDKVVAIGEIGLDYHYPDTNKELQKEWFVKQLNVAVDRQLPVIIHSRDAAEDTMNILKQYDGKLKTGVIHCYSYGVEMAKQYVSMGYYIGIGGVITFKNSKKLKEVAKSTPLDRIVIETDCPYLSPEPNRGKRNSSLNLPYVVRALAEIKEVSEEEILTKTYENAKRLYSL